MELLSSAAKYAFGPSSSRKCMLSLSYNKHHHYRLCSSFMLYPSKLFPSPSPSPSTSEYDLFFPSFYRDYMCSRVYWFASRVPMEDPVSLAFSLALPSYKQPMTCPHFEDEPHYTSVSVEPLPIWKGQHFDVISLLSTHADDLVRIGSPTNNNTTDFVKADTLRGKYILLCCAFVPSLWTGFSSRRLRQLSLLSSELYQGHNNVEVVIVPKMRQKWEDDEGVFNHFCSAFPGCLTLPFTHNKYRCDYICKSINFFKDSPRFFFVDPSQKVLEDCFDEMIRNGARGFPYTYERFRANLREDRWVEPSSPTVKSLAGLLGCESNPSSFLLRKFDSEETISVEQLNKHLVGLYLFNLGDKLQEFRDIYKQCRFEGLDFEIVLVCIPFNTSIYPELYQDVAHCALEDFAVSNWWSFPFNNSTCRRLSNFCENPTADSMFIVGPNNEFVTRQAGDLIRRFGFHLGTEAYPFSFKGLQQAFLQRLDAITLESFLTYDYVYRDNECDDSKIMRVSELKGKNVLVYVTTMTIFKPCWPDVLEDVTKWHGIIKEKDPDFEVVLVPVIDPGCDTDYPSFCSQVRECLYKSKTKWLVCPFHEPKYHKYLMKHEAFLFSCGEYLASKGVPIPSVLAFGEDGHLHSLDAIGLLDDDGIDKAYPFRLESRNSVLCIDIESKMFNEFDLWDDTVHSF